MSRAKELRELREKKGLTIAECCRMTGTHRNTWQSWETDESMQNSRPARSIAFAWLKEQKSRPR